MFRCMFEFYIEIMFILVFSHYASNHVCTHIQGAGVHIDSMSVVVYDSMSG